MAGMTAQPGRRLERGLAWAIRNSDGAVAFTGAVVVGLLDLPLPTDLTDRDVGEIVDKALRAENPYRR